MKNLILTFVLIILGINIYSQSLQLVIDEEFENNNNDWTFESTLDYETDFKNGFYIIKNKSESGWYFWNSFNINYSGYKVETRLKLVGSSDAYGGVIWFSNGTDQTNSFRIFNDGYYRILVDNDYDTILDITLKSSAIKINDFNILTVKKIHQTTLFYINNKLVYASSKPQNFDDDFGFIVSGNAELDIDYLKIYHKQPKIEIAENTFAGEMENLGSGINTEYTELKPIISPDGSTLYFIREGDPRNLGDSEDQDIWYASLLADSSWSDAKNIGRPLNNSSHNSVFYVSPDNNILYLSAQYDAFGDYADEGISYSVKQKDGTWSIPVNIEIDDFYNDNDYRNYAFSADRKVLLMAIERDDSYGDQDLYVSFLQPDGSYSVPKNMGPVLNTSKADFAPFLAADGKTLYFASYGHPGYGSSDIFVSKRLDDTWTHWSKPKNLGPTVNSNAWDAYFTLDAEGKYAYVVSDKSGYGEEDIFRIKIPEEAQPEPVIIVYGYVFDKKTNKPLDAHIAYTNMKNNEETATAVSNPSTGEYKLVLHYGESYQIYAKRKGYFALSDKIDLPKQGNFEKIRKDLYLVPIQKDQVIVLNNVYFQRGKAELLPESYTELNRVYKMLKENPEIRIEISGHTNNLGDRDKLIQLSWDRANAVKQYLVNKGINPDRMETKGYGPDKPIASNQTEEGRRKNQRVEFKILKK